MAASARAATAVRPPPPNSSWPSGVAVDSAGDLFIADTDNNVVREVNHATGAITTVAGNGTYGYSGDGGPATAAELANPDGVAVDSAGDLFIDDSNNSRIREVNLATGTITTIAGNGTYGYTGDGGAATAAELSHPLGIAVDSAGDLFIADSGNNVIREVNLATGTITTVAGNGTRGFTGDGSRPRPPNCPAPKRCGGLIRGPLHCRFHERSRPRGESLHRRDHHGRRQWHLGLRRR